MSHGKESVMAKLVNKMLGKYSKIPIEARASIWFVICSILQRGISFITVPIFTRLMSTEQYGFYSTYTSWYSVLIVFTSLNLYYGVFNNAMIKFENDRDRYISSMQGLVILITSIFFVFYLLFRDVCNSILGMNTPLVLLLFIELLVTPALQFWTVHNRFDYRYKTIVTVTLIKSILNPFVGIIFVLGSEQKDIARIISTVLVEVIICGTIATLQFYRGKCFCDKKYWKYAIVFNIPLIPHYLSGTILNQADRIMISNMVGPSAVAFYSVSYNLAQVMNMFITAIASSFTPWVYRKLRDKQTQDIAPVINILLLLMLCLLAVLMFLAPEVLLILAGKEYADAVYVIPPITASVFFIFQYNLFSNIEFYYAERKYVLIGSIAAALLNVILNAIFIPRFGYYAAGYTTLVCYIIYGLSHIWFSKRVVRKNGGNGNLYNEKVIIGMSFLIIGLTVVQNFLYQHLIIRYIIVVVILAIAFIKRNLVIGILKSIRKGEV